MLPLLGAAELTLLLPPLLSLPPLTPVSLLPPNRRRSGQSRATFSVRYSFTGKATGRISLRKHDASRYDWPRRVLKKGVLPTDCESLSGSAATSRSIGPFSRKLFEGCSV